jgi:hypothetical protein
MEAATEGPDPSNFYDSFKFAIESLPRDGRDNLSQDPMGLTAILDFVIKGAYVIQNESEPADSNLYGYDARDKWQNALTKLSSQYEQNRLSITDDLARTYSSDYYNQYNASLTEAFSRIGICPFWPFC